MNTPPLLLGCALLFWGWQTGFLAVGAILGMLLELPRITPARWTFSQADFDRLWNLCAVLFIGAAGYLFFSEGTLSFNEILTEVARRPDLLRQKGQAALIWFQWFPMLLYPFAVAAAWSEDPRVDVSTFSWFLRRHRRHIRDAVETQRINVAFPFYAVVLFATAASNQRNVLFYWGFCLLIGWALWSRRSRRYPAFLFPILLLTVTLAGHYSHRGFLRLGQALEEMNVAWFSRFAGTPLDARQSRTQLGSIGKLAQSDRIVLRLRTDGLPPPELLREASYSIFRAPIWQNAPKDPKIREITRVFPETTNNTTWILLTNVAAQRTITIGRYLYRGGGILALPSGTAVIDHLPMEEMDYSPHGVLRGRGGPGVVNYDARYGPGMEIDGTPRPEDQRVDDNDEPAISQVAAELGLVEGMNPKLAMATVRSYFTSFTYTTDLTQQHRATSNETALARFLLHERAGHCEYYATAAALLLRKAGLPTRYAVGYSVQEGEGRNYVARDRHAHAWALVYYKNRWQDFDVTPDDARGAAARVSWLRPIRDFFSNVWFQISKWRWSSTEYRRYLVWLPVPMVAFALASFFLKKQWRQKRHSEKNNPASTVWPGVDSEFYTVERLLARRGLERFDAESLGAWLRRISGRARSPEKLSRLVSLHLKYRFDPGGLSPEERQVLRGHSTDYLRELKQHS